MEKLAIIHFNPVDKYPPAVNLIRQLNDTGLFHIKIFTNRWEKLNQEWFNGCLNIELIYISEKSAPANRAFRLFHYIHFLVSVSLALLKYRPAKLLYYETLSSGPALFYKWIRGSKLDLLIHYHEYASLKEYHDGMIWNRILHKWESAFYHKAGWISHTNQQRLDFFVEDHKLDKESSCFHVFPNYPPASWAAQVSESNSNVDLRLRFVYVGALSLETMFTGEVAKVIALAPDRVVWDIYSENIDDDVVAFLNSLKASNIFLKGSVPYDQLPRLLPQYDIGLILYKATTYNYKFNAPNKLFEYLNCGLNVLYPYVMKGPEFYQTDIKPWVKSFDPLNFDIADLSNGRRIQEEHEAQYTAEVASMPILSFLTGKKNSN